MVELKEMFSEKEQLFKERAGEDFATLYTKYYQKLIYFSYKICNDNQKAEDISTDAFIIALNKINLYDNSKSQFSTWLFTIAKNLSLQELKNSKKSISLDVEYDNEGTTMKDFIFSIEDDNELLYSVVDEKARIIKDYMMDLKEPYKTVIEMREVDKMSYQDISDKLGRNLSTIKSQIRNGRQILMNRTKDEFKKLDSILID